MWIGDTCTFRMVIKIQTNDLWLMECRVVLNKSYALVLSLHDHGSCACRQWVSHPAPPAGPQPPGLCLLSPPFSCCDPALESNTAFCHLPQHGMPFSHPLPVKLSLCLQAQASAPPLVGSFDAAKESSQPCLSHFPQPHASSAFP